MQERETLMGMKMGGVGLGGVVRWGTVEMDWTKGAVENKAVESVCGSRIRTHRTGVHSPPGENVRSTQVGCT
jgi:hypothetical protein